MSIPEFRGQLMEKGLRVTPQRIAIYEAVVNLGNHPTVENIVAYIENSHPNISIGTVYKVLDSLVENQLLMKIKNDSGVMQYDAVLSRHHHLYCEESKNIRDFEDPELDKLIAHYFERKKIKGFEINDITLQITGKFKK